MALRRFAQENNAASPRTPDNARSNAFAPGTSTPRSKVSYGIYRSPADTPSISSSIPFDWDAVRTRAPPPYATPIKSRARMSMGTSTSSPGPRKAMIRKKGFIEKIQNIPSTIAFHVALFPENLPLPTPRTSARIIGGLCHFLHLLIHAQNDPGNDWDGPSERRAAWFDWTTPVTLLLLGFSFLNAYNLYSRTRNYQLHGRIDPVNSPSAKFVHKTVDLEPVERPPISRQILSGIWYGLSVSWRFLLGFQPPAKPTSHREKTSRVQEMDVWQPNEIELELFSIYSPAHAILWFSMSSSNWIMILIVMAFIGIQMNSLTMAYTQLLKDRLIISAETMKEYNEGFVWPRLHPVKKDAAVMTHQSEVVNVWEA